MLGRSLRNRNCQLRQGTWPLITLGLQTPFPPLDLVGLILFGSGVALLSYVLEIFGEHTLAAPEIIGLLVLAVSLIFGYGLHAVQAQFPLLQLRLFRIRTFRAAVSGSFFTRIGIGGVPFLLPLLYQVGLGFSPIQSGLMIMPQALGAMYSKSFVARGLQRLGYRGSLFPTPSSLACSFFCSLPSVSVHLSG